MMMIIIIPNSSHGFYCVVYKRFNRVADDVPYDDDHHTTQLRDELAACTSAYSTHDTLLLGIVD